MRPARPIELCFNSVNAGHTSPVPLDLLRERAGMVVYFDPKELIFLISFSLVEKLGMLVPKY